MHQRLRCSGPRFCIHAIALFHAASSKSFFFQPSVAMNCALPRCVARECPPWSHPCTAPPPSQSSAAHPSSPFLASIYRYSARSRSAIVFCARGQLAPSHPRAQTSSTAMVHPRRIRRRRHHLRAVHPCGDSVLCGRIKNCALPPAWLNVQAHSIRRIAAHLRASRVPGTTSGFAIHIDGAFRTAASSAVSHPIHSPARPGSEVLSPTTPPRSPDSSPFAPQTFNPPPVARARLHRRPGILHVQRLARFTLPLSHTSALPSCSNSSWLPPAPDRLFVARPVANLAIARKTVE